MKRIVMPFVGKVASAERARRLAQRPITIWLTGLSGSGKSTLAAELDRRLVDAGRSCYLLDGDNVRAGINRDLEFTPEDRRENIRRVAELAKLMNEAGLIVATALISPYHSDRRMARDIIGRHCFFEVYLSAPLEICEQRDPKGLYRMARAGELPDFTGVAAPYEVPWDADLVLDTATRTAEDCASELFAQVSAKVLP